jgi:glycosyltransferase involved in cell wall biosynthesis
VTRPLRILYLLGGYGDEHIGGAIHREMALEIRGRGHDYQLLVPARSDEAQRAPEASDAGVPVHRLVSSGSWFLDAVNRASAPVLRFPSLLTLAWRIERFLAERPRFDVLVAEGAYPLGTAAWLAARRSRLPFILSIVGGDFLANEEANYGFARFAVPRRLMRSALGGAAVVRAISPLAGERAVALGCPRERLSLVPRNIAAGAFLPGSISRSAFHREARQRLAGCSWAGTGALVVAVGRLLPIKGFDVLVRALPRVATETDVRLLLVGPNRVDSRFGDYRQHLEALAHGAGVADRLSFAGALPLAEIRDILAAADLVAIPSLEEGGNKVLLEATAVGTPFVSTRTAGNAEWARPWNCGVVVEPSSVEGLAAGITGLLANPGRAAVLGTNGLAFAQHFRTAPVAERILALCLVAAEKACLPTELKEPFELLHPPVPVPA